MTALPIKDTDDDQLYYTKLYLDENIKVGINLLTLIHDVKCVIYFFYNADFKF